MDANQGENYAWLFIVSVGRHLEYLKDNMKI